LSFHYIGDYWNDRISFSSRKRCLAISSRRLLQGTLDLAGYYESFFAEKVLRRRQFVSVYRADVVIRPAPNLPRSPGERRYNTKKSTTSRAQPRKA